MFELHAPQSIGAVPEALDRGEARHQDRQLDAEGAPRVYELREQRSGEDDELGVG